MKEDCSKVKTFKDVKLYLFPEDMSYKEAIKTIDFFNKESFCGQNNWRLPTLLEAERLGKISENDFSSGFSGEQSSAEELANRHGGSIVDCGPILSFNKIYYKAGYYPGCDIISKDTKMPVYLIASVSILYRIDPFKHAMNIGYRIFETDRN